MNLAKFMIELCKTEVWKRTDYSWGGGVGGERAEREGKDEPSCSIWNKQRVATSDRSSSTRRAWLVLYRQGSELWNSQKSWLRLLLGRGKCTDGDGHVALHKTSQSYLILLPNRFHRWNLIHIPHNHPFKVYDSVVVRTLMNLCNHHHNRTPEHFCHLGKKPGPLQESLHSPLP